MGSGAHTGPRSGTPDGMKGAVEIMGVIDITEDRLQALRDTIPGEYPADEAALMVVLKRAGRATPPGLYVHTDDTWELMGPCLCEPCSELRARRMAAVMVLTVDFPQLPVIAITLPRRRPLCHAARSIRACVVSSTRTRPTSS